MLLFHYDTTLGKIGIAEDEGCITNVYLTTDDIPPTLPLMETETFKSASEQLRSYLAGELREFSLPLAPRGTEFQRNVWRLLMEIPYGHTASYQQIAIAAGNPKAVRAVGMANHRNPIPIFIPCHRVIGKGGALVGYRGGIEMKRMLLGLEGYAPILNG